MGGAFGRKVHSMDSGFTWLVIDIFVAGRKDGIMRGGKALGTGENGRRRQRENVQFLYDDMIIKTRGRRDGDCPRIGMSRRHPFDIES